jgi:spore coat polysaccharide biosynthesis protein SpsF
MKIGVIIQARMGSRRLPGKSLSRISGRPMLGYVVERARRAEHADFTVVATSSSVEDAAILDFCRKAGVPCHAGPLDDVAGRFKGVLLNYPCDGFVRISGDSPLIDQRLIDKAAVIFRRGNFDLVTNVMERTYPSGQSVEVLNSRVFLKVYERMHDPQDLEHVTGFFYRNARDFSVHNFASGKDYGPVKLSVDTQDDLKTVTSIIARMKRPHWEYAVDDVVGLLEEHEKT